MSKIKGSVKWFSNRKGYGFITPADGSPISDDIFVHQSSLHCEGYRTLGEGWEVEFEIGHDDDGKAKAVNVTAPGGGPCQGERKKKRGGSGGNNGKPANRNPVSRGPASAKPKEPFWHEVLCEDVKNILKEKDIRTTTGTVDVALGDSRVKLGTHNYASVAHAAGIIGEGTFVCNENGVATFTWDHCIAHGGNGSWIADKEKASSLPCLLSLADASVLPVGSDETAETLWGDKPDPKEALEANGFLMRRVVLTPRRRY